MNKQEFAQFTMALKTYYPRENLLPNNQAMELWFRQLQDIPYKVAEIGLNKWVATNKWSPSIADIREVCSSVSEPDVPDWGDAWEEVINAISRFGMYRADDAVESMTPLTAQAVKRIGFVNICTSENPSADRANFRLIYEQLAQRKKADMQIPQVIKDLIGQIKPTEERPMIEHKEEVKQIGERMPDNVREAYERLLGGQQ